VSAEILTMRQGRRVRGQEKDWDRYMVDIANHKIQDFESTYTEGSCHP